MDNVVDLSSQKIESISRIGLPNPKRNRFCFFGARGLVHVPNFGGLSGSEDRGGGDNSIQFINFGRVGDNNILTFSSYCTR